MRVHISPHLDRHTHTHTHTHDTESVWKTKAKHDSSDRKNRTTPHLPSSEEHATGKRPTKKSIVHRKWRSSDDDDDDDVINPSAAAAASLRQDTKRQEEEENPAMSSSSSSSASSKKDALFITGLVVLWYSSNIGVLLLNKYLLSNYGFRFPIFLTMCHMSACAILSYLSIVFLKVVPLQAIKSRTQFFKIATLSIVFCGSVVGGNISLRFLPVSFNQAVGATTPFFTAVFAYLMTFKREAWVTYAALVPVVAGVVIASGGEPGFHWYGFIMCISATAARAFKSVLQGILLSSEGEKLNSMNLLLYMSPIAVLVLLPAAIIMEPNVLEVTLSLGKKYKFMWLLLLLNSTMAYSANLTNFLVTKHTSALTLQVLGNAKGAVAVVISIFIFRNPVTFVGIAGYTMTVAGVVAYGEAKRRFR